jgi:hypothetical protein
MQQREIFQLPRFSPPPTKLFFFVSRVIPGPDYGTTCNTKLTEHRIAFMLYTVNGGSQEMVTNNKTGDN